MGRIHVLIAQGVDAIEDVEQILLGVDARALDARHDLADHLLPWRRPRLVLEPLEIGQQLLVDEREHRPECGGAKVTPLRPVGVGPIPPAVRRLQRGREVGPDRLSLLGLALLALIEDSEEEDPRQLGDVLQRPRAVRAPHDVADRLHRGVHRLLGGKEAAVAVPR